MLGVRGGLRKVCQDVITELDVRDDKRGNVACLGQVAFKGPGNDHHAITGEKPHQSKIPS